MNGMLHVLCMVMISFLQGYRFVCVYVFGGEGELVETMSCPEIIRRKIPLLPHLSL